MLTPVNLLVLTALAGVLMLFVLGSLVRSRIGGIRECIWANGLMAVSLLTFVAQTRWAWVGIITSNLLLAVSMCLLFSGVRRFWGLPVPWAMLVAAVSVTMTVLGVFYFIWPSLAVRVVAVSLLHGALCAWMAVTVLRVRPRLRPAYSYRFTFLIAAFASIGHALRAGVYAFVGVSGASLLDSTSMWNIAFLTVGVLVMPGLTLGMIMMIHDRMLDEREREADTDFLTSVLNRKAWWHSAESMLERALRSGQPMTLLMVDLDRFKQINDLHGHPIGDGVLKHFAQLSRAVLRAQDHLGRIGGEEFAVLLPGLPLGPADVAANRLLDVVHGTPYLHGRQALTYTFSGGLAQWRRGESLQALVQRADAALYMSKAGGRNRVTASQA